jgi:hypothetical protein
MRGLAVVAVAGVLGLLSPAAEAKRASCHHKGRHTEVANEKALVFQTYADAYADHGSYYGCLRRTGRRTRLGGWYSHPLFTSGPESFRLRGALVGFVDSDCSQYYCTFSAATVDLRSGRTIRHYDDESKEDLAWVAALRVAKGGSLALVRGVDPHYASGAPPTYSLLTVTRGGGAELDSGTDIDPESLAIRGGRVYWTRAGEPFSAPID